MAKIVFKVVSVVLEHVERPVLDFPTCAATGCKFCNVGRRDRKVRDEAIVIGSLAASVQNLHREPVYNN